MLGVALLMASCSTTELESGTDPTLPPVTEATTTTAATTATTDDVVTSDAPASTTTIVANTTTTTVVPLSGWAAVDRYLELTLIRNGSQAAGVAVLRNGELVHDAAYGQRIEGDPAEPADRFRVASISKTILAITALALVEDDVLSLDEPVGGLLADRLDVATPASGTASITVRDLLTHRSGFPQYEELFFRNEVDSCAAAARVGFTRPLQSTPATSFQYSNMNFCVLGILIEQVTGAPYWQIAQQQVLDPLGITAMRTAGTFDVRRGDVEHASTAGRNYMETLGGAGAWIAAPADIATVLNSIDSATPGTKSLTPETIGLMATITVTPPVPADPDDPDAAPTTTVEPAPPTDGYGMGLMIFERPVGGDVATATFGHTGTLESTHSMFVRRPDGFTWALTVSGEYPSSTRELATIMDNALLLGGFVDGSYTTPPPPISGE